MAAAAAAPTAPEWLHALECQQLLLLCLEISKRLTVDSASYAQLRKLHILLSSHAWCLAMLAYTVLTNDNGLGASTRTDPFPAAFMSYNAQWHMLLLLLSLLLLLLLLACSWPCAAAYTSLASCSCSSSCSSTSSRQIDHGTSCHFRCLVLLWVHPHPAAVAAVS
jgi:hypothetical protein